MSNITTSYWKTIPHVFLTFLHPFQAVILTVLCLDYLIKDVCIVNNLGKQCVPPEQRPNLPTAMKIMTVPPCQTKAGVSTSHYKR